MAKKSKSDILDFLRVPEPRIGYRFWLIPVIILLGFYRVIISPIFYAFGVRCRHTPSCSVYGQEAFIRFGFWRGGWLTLSRLLRCHPWGSHGHDPVPDVLTNVGWQFWRYGDWSWRPRGFELRDDELTKDEHNQNK